MLPGWDDPNLEPEVAESKNYQEVETDENGQEVDVTKTVAFTDEQTRVSELAAWVTERKKWIGPELLARQAMRYFESFYTLYAKIEKEGEKLELLVADGMLSWTTDSAIDGPVAIRHPIIFKRVELRFNPNIPEFTVHETEREVELYSSLFLDLKDVESRSVRNRKEELENSGYHPLGWDDTTAYLKSFALTVSPTQGEFLEEPADGDKTHPRVWRDPVLFLRNRTAGIGTAVDKIIDHIERQTAFPPALSWITGEEVEWVASGLARGKETQPSPTGDIPVGTLHAAKDILLVDEANDEQIEIVKRLDRSGSVVVQGPPGTGKTHTISNLIGHLLSQGKSILVTAHTVKALRVLRDKVPDMLKPLCVSVLGSDQLARRQLESAVSSITERLTSETHDSLLRKGERYVQERNDLIRRQLELKHLLREAIESEYKAIEIGGRKYSPADAARFISEKRQGNDWIPSPIDVAVVVEGRLPQIERLYALGASFSKQEEDDSRLHLPKLTDLPNEARFRQLVTDLNSLLTQDLSKGRDSWIEGRGSSEELTSLLAQLLSEFDDELLAQSWRPYAIVAGIHGAVERQVWQSLIEKIDAAVEASAKYSLTLQHRASLSEDIAVHKQLDLIDQICRHLEAGGKLGFLQLATKSEWRQLLKGARVAAGEPTHIEHFKAIRQLADLKAQRLDLEQLWNALIGNQIKKPFDQLGPAPEQACRSLIPEVKRCLNWSEAIWKPLAEKLKVNGLKLDQLVNALPRDASQVAEYAAIEKFAKSELIAIVETEVCRRKLKEIELEFEKLKDLIVNTDPSRPDQGCVGRITKAVANKDAPAYEEALDYLRRILSVKPLVEERESLLSALKNVAPTWANLIAQRTSPHDQGTTPGNVITAWTWRQLSEILDERGRLDAQHIQKELDGVAEMLREVTRLLVDAKAWAEQLKRLQSDNAMRQALVGWLDTAQRLVSTRQLDKRQTLLSEARKLMRKCSQAVPVWIMPISIMAESFDPQTTSFDVVIIDEASQADINALIPLYMGKQIIVVGDHQQVTPLGVGKDQTILENLRKSMLKDIPNAHLYDNMSSIYDLARQSFGEGIRLVEHFRCVPQIISFSNALSYEGKIRPLREASSSNLKPSCVPYRVNGIREGDVNREEAGQIVSLIKAMTRHKAYEGKTIGVISMLGESQAVLIQSMIHKELESVEIEARRIQAGISGEFQGDERDVMFLSLVDSAADTNPLRTTGDGAFEQTKKRYNVAASRAKDQLWVIHSFDPELHLNSTDIRFRLLQHVKDPDSSSRNFEQEVGRTESPFEREVLKRLTNAGYRVQTQVQVGYFRIDMVVEGKGKRLAVECDGDRYHPIEQLAADMNRQAILERLGWRFARIRGSAFYRDPEQAMKAVFKRLEELEIEPHSTQTSQGTGQDTTLIDELRAFISNGFVEPAVEIRGEDSLGDDRKSEFLKKLRSLPPNVRIELLQNELRRREEGTAYGGGQATGGPQTLDTDAVKGTDAPRVVSELPLDDDAVHGQEHDLLNQQGSPLPPKLIKGLPNQLSEYVHYSGPDCQDPRTSSEESIKSGLKRIVEIEGPIQSKRAIDIYLRSCGIKRMGHDIEHKMISAVNALQEKGELSFDKFRDDQDVLEEIIWLKGSPSISVRRRGDRSLEEIPLNELFYISQIVASRQGLELYSESHKRAVLEELELKRLTSNTDSILRLAFSIEFEVLAKQSRHDFGGDEWVTKLQPDYFHESGRPIQFNLGRLNTIVSQESNQLVCTESIYVWALNEFSEPRIKLFGVSHASADLIHKAQRFVEILNFNAKDNFVPIDFDDWWQDELSERERDQIMCG
jgi:very-short-patch-repair endonuclease/superfamily I DNA/RNA helicase